MNPRKSKGKLPSMQEYVAVSAGKKVDRQVSTKEPNLKQILTQQLIFLKKI